VLGAAVGRTAFSAQETEAPAGEAEECVTSLGDPDYERRHEAFERLEQLGDAAREALEEAADSDDPEVRWNVARLLDRLNRTESEGHSRRLRPLRSPDSEGARAPDDPSVWMFERPNDLLREMDDLLRRVDPDGRQDFRGFFRGRPFHFRFFDDPFGILDEVARSSGGPPELAPGTQFSRTEIRDGQRQSWEVSVDADGKVVAEHRRGEDVTRVEADSVEDFRRQHPEFLEAIQGAVGDVVPHSGPVRTRPLVPRRFHRIEPPAQSDSAPGPKLGVRVEPVHPAVAEHLDLAPGVGLVVREVLEDSLAETLGIQVGDLLVELNGREIRGVPDVAAALREGRSPARVTLIRKGRVIRPL